MENMNLEEKYAFEYIIDTLNSSRIKSVEPEDARYHHNTSYEKTPSIITNGILSEERLAKLQKREISESKIRISEDPCYACGIKSVSLSAKVDDLRRDEWEYKSDSPYETDILIARNIKAGRHTINYGNEFLVMGGVENTSFRGIDIRILKQIEKINDELYNFRTRDKAISDLIRDYNQLKLIAKALIDAKLDIPLREMSNENMTLDINKIAKGPELKLVIK